MEVSFEIHWPYLALALAMLWFPRQWMRLGKWRPKRRKERETMEKFATDGAVDPEDKSVRLARELKSPRNYLDFFRALVGGVSLWEFSFTFGGEDRAIFFGLKIGITLIAVLIQLIRWRERITFFAPIFFFAGLSIGMGNYFSGAMAFLLMCAINPVIPTPRLFISAFALLLLPFNVFLGAGLQLAVINSLLVLLGPLLSLLAKRPMVIFTRKRNLMW
ncbi:MAG: hypothetical protein C0518_16175 [Opitutus sp.]|nr:hypothetical protein [Opitutus sp.]